MYYSGIDLFTGPLMIGLATSSDGINWTKFDDPATTSDLYAESDPVLKPAPFSSQWDSLGVWYSHVRTTATGWEMYYTGTSPGTDSLGYASSLDGVTWSKDVDNPIFEAADDPAVDGGVAGPCPIDVGAATLMYIQDYMGTPAQVHAIVSDNDSDNVGDHADNCQLIANADQRDTDNDGFGNLCDADLTGNCIVNFDDLAAIRTLFFTANEDADFNGDGIVNFADLSIMSATFFSAPGPSGLPTACDGS